MKKVMLAFLFIMYTVFIVPSCFGSYTGRPICVSNLHYTEVYNSESSEAEEDYKLNGSKIIYVYNQKDLEYIRERVNKGIESYRGKLIILKASMNLKNWSESIGNYKYNFEGTFEGEGHIILGFKGEPLFGCINKSTIANLTVEGRIFNNKLKVNTYSSFDERLNLTALGGIAKVAMNSSFENCDNECTIASIGCAGGICGCVYGNVDFYTCKNKACLIGKGAAGGIFGSLYQTHGIFKYNRINLLFCKNDGAIEGNSACGGLIGCVQSSNDYKNFVVLKSCTNRGNIKASQNYAGGFIGVALAQIRVRECLNQGNVQGVNYVGGFCGLLKSNKELTSFLSVEKSKNLAKMDGENCVGGFLGYGYNMKVESSENYGNITGKEFVGGLSGRVFMLLFKKVLNEGSIRGNLCVGGLCGCCSRTFKLYGSINKGRVFAIECLGNLIGATGEKFLPV